MTEKEAKLQEEVTFLKKKVERLKDELVRMVSRNLDLTERLEYDVELKRRTEVAREMIEGHAKRLRNADLQDDGQLMAIIEMRLEKDRPHLRADFSTQALADMLGVSMNRLNLLFRHQTMHRPPRPISTTSARWRPCACCATSPTTPLPSWPKKPASAMSAHSSAAFRKSSA